MNKLTFFEVLKRASLFIKEHHGDENAPEIIMMDLMNWNKSQLLMNYRTPVSADFEQKYNEALKQAANNVPVQYITHKSYFYQRPFYVDSRVLIPRLETEELVELVLKQHESDANLSVLDIGTGSGDIAITLKLERSNWSVTGVDISGDALAVAKKNAQELQADVEFLEGSLFEPVDQRKFDIIISNPPYIADYERDVMDESVLKYEPNLALFAEDSGLYWYKRIADQMGAYLNSPGELFCEFGYNQGSALVDYFNKKHPSASVMIRKDLSENDRILWVKTR